MADDTRNTNADGTPSASAREGARDALEHTLNADEPGADASASETSQEDAVDESLVADVEKQLAESIRKTPDAAPAQGSAEGAPAEAPRDARGTQAPDHSERTAQPAANAPVDQPDSYDAAAQPRPADTPEETTASDAQAASLSPREQRMQRQAQGAYPADTAAQDTSSADAPAARAPRETHMAEDRAAAPQSETVEEAAPTQSERTEEAAPVQPAEQEAAGADAERIDTTEDAQPAAPRERQPAAPRGKEPARNASQDTELPTLRTYKSDIAAAMKRNKTSRTDIAAAEQERTRATKDAAAQKETQDAQQQQKRRWPLKRILVVGAIVLLGVGGVGALGFAGYAIFLAPSEEPDTEQIQPYTLIPTNEQQEVTVTGQRPQALRTELTRRANELPLSLGEIGVLYLVTETAEGRVRTSTAGLFEHIGANIPSELRRTLAEAHMLGVHAFDGAAPFLLLRITNFETAFSGMLSWESDMNDDLAPLFGPELESFVQTGTSTQPQARRFEDLVLQNQDVRAVRNDAGEIALLYAFPRRDALIITTNENTLKEVLSRMRARTIVQ